MRSNKYLYLFYFLLPAFFITELKSTTLNISQTVNITSITYNWDNITGSNYNAVLSTESSFSSYISSQTLSLNTTTYTNLKGNTTYYFKVKISTENDTNYLQISTVTFTQIPYNIEAIYNLYDLTPTPSAKIVINFPDENATDTLYDINYSTDKSFAISSHTFLTGSPPFELSSLLTNTTYYIQIKAYDRIRGPTTYSASFSTQTITKFPDNFYFDFYETSVTFNWTALAGPEQENSSSGYSIIIAAKDDFSNIIDQWSTTDNSTNTYTNTSPLLRNSTYYYRFSVFNSIGVENRREQVFYTLTNKPSNFKLINFSSSIATLGWDRFPSSPSQDSALGYVLQASTITSFNEVLSSQTYDLSLSTLTIKNLEANTTYYFRIGALNYYGIANYSDILSTVTLSIQIPITDQIVNPRSITIEFADLPNDNDYLRSYQYLFEASTTNFVGGTVYSSSTIDDDGYNLQKRYLTIDSLKPNTTYYLRLATFNRMMIPNYSDTVQVLTPIPSFSQTVDVFSYSSNTLSVVFSTIDTDGYTLEISTDNYFRTISYSSTAYSNDIATLTISGIIPNTQYYIRLGSIFGGSTVYILANPQYITTLTPPPTNQKIENVYISSISINWSSVPCNGYLLEASTTSMFLNILSSMTFNADISTLTVSGLIPNTTYYLRVGSINSANEKNYASIPPTSTLANFPIELAMTNHTTYSMQINWNTNSNPNDTLYIMEISSTNFTDGTIYSSSTYNNFAYFDGLQSNTTYYKRISAINRNNVITGPLFFTPIATLAYKVVNLVVVSSKHYIQLKWEDSNNAVGTPYLCEISSTNFIDSIISSQTLSKSVTFYNLNSNTPYYIRVSALNFSNIPSDYERTISTTYVELPEILGTTYLNILLDGFTAQWSNNTNSTHTIYQVDASTSSDFLYIFRTTQTHNTTLVFGNLNYDTKYYIRIKSIGLISGDESQYVILPDISTLYREEKVINNQILNTVSIPFSYGTIEVEIPPYALGSVTRIFIEPESNPPAPKSKAGNLNPTGFATKIYIFPLVLYNGMMKVKIPYKDLPSTIDKNKLVMARYDDTAGLWVPLKSYITDTYVIGETYHFSTFQIMKMIASNSLNSVKIYPNPFKPNTTLGKLNFSNMPPYTKISIYTITGELIIKLKTDDKGFVQWDGKNSNKKDVASGVYMAVFENNGQKLIKKFVIEK